MLVNQRQRLSPVGRLCNNDDTRIAFEQCPQARSDKRVIIGKQHMN